MHNPPMVLVADDEPATANLLKVICDREGFVTHTASDGQQAIDKANALTPDLILLDVQMPGIDGFGVVEALRQHEATAQIPIIVITAAATGPEDAAKGINLGADDYLHKPFHNKELLARIHAKIRNRELEERLFARNRELDALVHLGVEINRPHELESLAHRLLKFLNQQLNSAASLLNIAQPNEGIAAHFMLQAGEGSVTHSPDALENITAAPTNSQLLDAAAVSKLFPKGTYQDGIVVPLVMHESVIGIMATARKDGPKFGENDLRLMRSASQQAALAVRNTQLYDSLRSYADLLEVRVEERTAELENAQKQLIRSEKLASLGRLSGEIAHEVNNPLQPIMTCLEGALEDLAVGQPVDPQDLSMAMSEVQRLKRTVARLLDFARPDTGGVRATNIAELIEEVLLLTGKTTQQAKVEVSSDLQPIQPVQVNPDQIQQVLLNLIINATDAMASSDPKRLEIQFWQAEGFAHIKVKDTGEGIAPEQLGQVFEPFFSTKDDGAGLGLAVSHSIVEAHGGQLDVTSQPGAGTEFRISLPLT